MFRASVPELELEEGAMQVLELAIYFRSTATDTETSRKLRAIVYILRSTKVEFAVSRVLGLWRWERMKFEPAY